MAVDLNYEKDSKERIPYEHYLEVYQNADPAGIRSRRSRMQKFWCCAI